MNLMEVNATSDFSKTLREVIKERRPEKIIETGTYRGQGTTTIIASAIRDFAISLVKFYSIEVNPHYYRSAYIHLRDSGLLYLVNLVNGLSIYRSQLPSRDRIKEKFLDSKWPDNVYIDHSKEVRVDKYYEETHFDNIPEGMLVTCLEKLDRSPDLVLLDSGGHMGEEEFEVLVPILRKPCIIALDDVFHVKHYRNLQRVVKDRRFTVLNLSKEKFGFCIAKFDPRVR